MPVTEVTRRAIIDELTIAKLFWWGDLAEPVFLNRLYVLSSLPSYDLRFADAAADMTPGEQPRLGRTIGSSLTPDSISIATTSCSCDSFPRQSIR